MNKKTTIIIPARNEEESLKKLLRKFHNRKKLFKEIGKRIRNVLTLPSGELLLITDKKNGQLIKVKRK